MSMNITAPLLSLEERMEMGARLAMAANPLKSFTPYILGMWVDAVLFGYLIGLVIEWKKYVYPTEKPVIKVLVFFVLLICSISSGHVMASQLYRFAAGFGVYKNFLNPNWHKWSWILNPLSRVPAGAFFTHRAWLLNDKTVIIPVLCIPLLIANAACSFGAFATAVSIPIKMDSYERLFVVITVCAELAVDIISTVAIAIGLYRRRTGWKSTDHLIVRLFVVLAETQLPPTIVALLFLICFIGFPNSRNVYMFAGIAKVHVLCLVAVLNNRVRMISENETLSYHQSYRLKDTPTITVETYIHEDVRAGDDKDTIKLHPTNSDSQADSNGVLRTVNGRAVGASRRDSYRELDSSTSLVVSLDT